jgi:hypothetical protein
MGKIKFFNSFEDLKNDKDDEVVDSKTRKQNEKEYKKFINKLRKNIKKK